MTRDKSDKSDARSSETRSEALSMREASKPVISVGDRGLWRVPNELKDYYGEGPCLAFVARVLEDGKVNLWIFAQITGAPPCLRVGVSEDQWARVT